MNKPPTNEIPDTCICGIDWHPWCKLHGTDSQYFKKWEKEVFDAKPEDKRK